MKTKDLFNMQNWKKGDRYQMFKQIFNIKDNFLFLPIYYYGNSTPSKKNFKENLILPNYRERDISEGRDCNLFFLILNNKLYLLDNAFCKLVLEAATEKTVITGDMDLSIKEITDINRKFLLGSNLSSIGKDKDPEFENGVKSMRYINFAGENWYDIKAKFLEDGLYWGKFKTFFLIKILQWQIFFEKNLILSGRY
jgi:hypothetical protein